MRNAQGRGVGKGGRVVRLQENTDVFVIGAGPAGLAAAIAARQKGFEVVVADGSAPPIEKPCGEGMMPETLAGLRTLGVELGAAEGHRFSGICFVQEGACVTADFPQGSGIGLPRSILHERMVARAEECGVQLRWRTPVAGIDQEGVRLATGKVRARWIVGADGQGSRVRRWGGLDITRRNQVRFARRRHYRVKPWSSHMQIWWGQHAQAYVTPTGPEENCIVIMSETPGCAPFDAALQEWPELRARLANAQLRSRERGAVTSMRSLRRVQHGNVALVGDASGSVDAITGEGLRMAFRQATALAQAMVEGDLTSYEHAHRALVRRPMLMGDLMLWLGRNPRIRRRVVCTMKSRPDLFARFLATHVGTTDSKSLLSAGARLSWQLLHV
jgi:flavin-dependent dehydrogenase